ncbi:Do family serine endopeptidase [Cypionkella sp.]|uniref:Do family serine endopeptidase n=1 Tax=Cypionkella sp. TaxID=2811411 RepID=UPI0027156E7C|nr:Do family serine endopeptidase [Cypionkella sp.]MDO8985963.1 Do family serine endopeptidase [Cypionkella sp.]MDP2048151.1 Do family serine endopeptidase [Cypionkella sp.]
MTSIRFFHVLSLLLVVAAQTPPIAAETSLFAPPTLAPMVERAVPSVVSIAVTGTSQSDTTPLLADPFFRQFFEGFGQLPPAEQPFQAAGSGVIVDAAEGLLLTNAHVVANAEQITVRLMDGTERDAKVVGVDPETDVAALRIAPEGLVEIPIGQSSSLRVGDYVVAIGNPFGLEQTVTLGIVSALGRRGLGIEGYENFIQTDASINPGNSGGALVNLAGELVGINTAILTPSQGSAGIGFAIPVDMAMAIADQLVRDGQVRRGQLGVFIQDVTPGLARALDLDAPGGALVAQVMPGGPAEAAGLRPRDVIVALDGVVVTDPAALRYQIGLRSPDQKITLDIARDGKRMMVEAVLAAKDQTLTQQRLRTSGEAEPSRLQGLALAEDQRGSMVAAVEPASGAARAGLMVGDRIIAVGSTKVDRIDQFRDAVTAAAPDDPILIEVERQGTPVLLALP